MSTFVISLVVVGGTIALAVRMVLGEETQPAMGDRVRDRTGRFVDRVRTAGTTGARRAAAAGGSTVRAARATTTNVVARQRGFVPYEPMGDVLDGPELPWIIRIRSGVGLAVVLTLVGIGVAVVIGLLVIGLASALENAVK